MKASDCMHSDIHFLLIDQSLRSVARLMSDSPQKPFLVMDMEGNPLGVLDQSSLVEAIAAGRQPGEPIGSLPLSSIGMVGPDEQVDALPSSQLDHWLVFDGRQILGLIDRRDVQVHDVLRPEGFFQRLEWIVDCIDKPILAIDTECAVRLCNNVACKVVGRSREEVIGLPVTSLFDPSRPKTLLTGNRFELLQQFRTGNTTYRTNWAPIKVQQEMIGAFAILRDVTDYETMSSELERVRVISRELNAIIDSSFDGIYLTDGDGRTLRINQAYERITGIKSHEVVGKTMQELVEEDVYNESVSLRVLKQRQAVTIVQYIKKTNKTIVVTGNPIFDDEGNIIRVVTNVRDVTELNQLQKKIKRMEQLQSRYEIELQQFRESVEDRKKFVIKSRKMLAVYELALKLAGVDSTILIQGESGVGKEVFSEIVHNHGQRRGKPFIKISCAAIPENLLESELFGYAPGAFTGASREGRAGIFELANGGTIFLDEIGEMPMGLQVKLLRVLQEREIVRIGSSTPIQVDTRIMAATNRDLEEMVQRNQFRKDLFFRLNVVPVMIPPLRERKEAISHFVYFFLEKYNSKYGFSKQITPEVIDALIDYEWPGNVRELENMVERLVVLAQGEVITADKLPRRLQMAQVAATPSSFVGKPLKQAMEDFERQILVAAIEEHGSSRKVAAALGVNQSTIVRKAARLGILIGK